MTQILSLSSVSIDDIASMDRTALRVLFKSTFTDIADRSILDKTAAMRTALIAEIERLTVAADDAASDEPIKSVKVDGGVRLANGYRADCQDHTPVEVLVASGKSKTIDIVDGVAVVADQETQVANMGDIEIGPRGQSFEDVQAGWAAKSDAKDAAAGGPAMHTETDLGETNVASEPGEIVTGKISAADDIRFRIASFRAQFGESGSVVVLAVLALAEQAAALLPGKKAPKAKAEKAPRAVVAKPIADAFGLDGSPVVEIKKESKWTAIVGDLWALRDENAVEVKIPVEKLLAMGLTESATKHAVYWRTNPPGKAAAAMGLFTSLRRGKGDESDYLLIRLDEPTPVIAD